MKSFLIKLATLYLIFGIPFGYYCFFVYPSLSGDIGELGQIPYGREYDGLDVVGYHRAGIEKSSVINVCDKDSLSQYDIVTVGDSFSQMGEYGYQWKLSSLASTSIANFQSSNYQPIQDAVGLLNSGSIVAGQFLIVETVERYCISRLLSTDFSAQYALNTIKGGGSAGETFLNRYLSWIRLSANYDNPIKSYKLTQNCFSHPKYSSTLHCYRYDIDWINKDEQAFGKAVTYANRLIAIAQEKGVKLILLIAADKYDAYGPWIVGDHVINPTMSYFEGIEGVYCTKQDLQDKIAHGVKDVYKLNNTHWSVIGADIVAEKLYSRL